MFRFSLLSFLLISVTSAVDIESLSKSELERKLQFEGLEDLVFNFGGITFSALVASEKCPTEWDATIQCILKDCPTIMEVCPDLTAGVPSEFMGSAAPGAGPSGMMPTAMNATDMMDMNTTDMMDMNTTDMMDMNTTDMMNTMMPTDMMDSMTTDMMNGTSNMTTSSMPTNDTRFLQAATTAPIPECDELDKMFCDFLGGEDLSECCLFECINQLQALFVCVIKETTGEDRSDCEVPDCPTPAPAPTATTKPVAKPASGAGVPAGSRVAALAASLLAFAVL